MNDPRQAVTPNPLATHAGTGAPKTMPTEDEKSPSTNPRLQRWITEAFVIVSSILLAFALDAWWDERQEQADLDEVLAAITEEFEAEITVMDSIVVENEAGFEDLVELIRVTDPDRQPLSEEEIRDRGSQEPGGSIYESGFGTLSALISSGGLERISDVELRRRLAAWPAHLEDAEWGRNQIYDGVDRLIERQAEIGRASDLLDGAVWQSRVRATATDPLYRQYHASLGHSLRAYTEGLRQLRYRAAEILELLRAR